MKSMVAGRDNGLWSAASGGGPFLLEMSTTRKEVTMTGWKAMVVVVAYAVGRRIQQQRLWQRWLELMATAAMLATKDGDRAGATMVEEVWQHDRGLRLRWLDCTNMTTRLQDLGGEVTAEMDSRIGHQSAKWTNGVGGYNLGLRGSNSGMLLATMLMAMAKRRIGAAKCCWQRRQMQGRVAVDADSKEGKDSDGGSGQWL
ncbi:hypothetical protein BHE74_00043523 [Ensete ventricosum]|nr:hypothetical protein BHE74_00043523 [Ensete ventricosum]